MPLQRNRTLGQATIAILKSMSEGHRFGLDLMETTGLPSGTVYPTLSRLEDRAFVSGQWEPESDAKKEGRPKRRYYTITPTGEKALKAALTKLEFLVNAAGGAEPAPRHA